MSSIGTKRWNREHGGFLSDLGEDQREQLNKFLEAVSGSDMEEVKWEHETNESFACRFLRARKFVAEDAIKMFHVALEWRRDFRPQELVQRPANEVLGFDPDEMNFFYPHTYLPNRSKDGYPVYIERTGEIDVEAMLLMSDIDHLLDYHVFSMETNLRRQFRGASEAAGHVVDQAINVLDLKGLSSKQLNATTKGYLQRLGKLASDYYPEMMHKMVVINTPTIFTMAWSVLKTFVDEGTRKKIEIYGGESNWKPRLKELIGEEYLPKEYGGTLHIDGPLFLQSRTHRIKVGSGKTHAYEVDLKKGQHLRVKWFTRPSDIKFSLTFRPSGESGGSVVHVVPLAAVKHSGSQVQINEFTAPSDGSALVLYDNSAAWRERRVYERHDVLDSGDSGAPAAAAGGGGSASSDPPQ